MGRTSIVTTIDKTGPFFTKDPGKTFRQNVRVMMEAFATEGQNDVQAQMQAGEAARAPISALGGRVSDHVVGRVTSLAGKPWAVTAVISVQNVGFASGEAISLMAAASRVESQTKAFKRTTGRLRRARSVNKAELLKGIV